MPVEETVWKNRPVLGLLRKEGDTYPFRFGLAKAKLILENIEAIRDFVKRHEE